MILYKGKEGRGEQCARCRQARVLGAPHPSAHPWSEPPTEKTFLSTAKGRDGGGSRETQSDCGGIFPDWLICPVRLLGGSESRAVA